MPLWSGDMSEKKWWELLPDKALQRYSDGPYVEADYALMIVAVLRAGGGCLPTNVVRSAVTKAMEPRLIFYRLDKGTLRHWKRLVGQQIPLSIRQYEPTCWANALNHLRANGRIVEDLDAATWSLGVGLERYDTSGWYDGRGRFVLEFGMDDSFVDSLLSGGPAC